MIKNNDKMSLMVGFLKKFDNDWDSYKVKFDKAFFDFSKIYNDFDKIVWCGRDKLEDKLDQYISDLDDIEDLDDIISDCGDIQDEIDDAIFDIINMKSYIERDSLMLLENSKKYIRR